MIEIEISNTGLLFILLLLLGIPIISELVILLTFSAQRFDTMHHTRIAELPYQ